MSPGLAPQCCLSMCVCALAGEFVCVSLWPLTLGPCNPGQLSQASAPAAQPLRRLPSSAILDPEGRCYHCNNVTECVAWSPEVITLRFPITGWSSPCQ